MKKSEAISMLGGTPATTAKALGYMSAHAVYMWPDDLPEATADRVRGAALRLDAKKSKRKPKQAA